MARIRFTPDTKARKHLAAVIAQTIDATVAYAGAPSFAYHVGQARLDRDWCLHLPQTTNPGEVIEAAVAAGFHPEPTSEEVGLTLVFPTTEWTGGTGARLQALLAAKGPLIAKALSVPALSMEVDEGEGVVRFAWFTQVPDPDTVEAVTRLLEAMIDYAKAATRINPKSRQVENEKYAMRCFLLRLGMIGNDTKHTRRLLMRNLDGNSAWRTPPAPSN